MAEECYSGIIKCVGMHKVENLNINPGQAFLYVHLALDNPMNKLSRPFNQHPNPRNQLRSPKKQIDGAQRFRSYQARSLVQLQSNYVSIEYTSA